MKRWIILAIMTGFAGTACAQYLVPDTTVPVFGAGDYLSQPWVGGLNQAQISVADFDGDGTDEVFIYDRGAIQPKIFSFDSQLQEWIWLSGKETYFPNLATWAIAADLNCDDLPDLITGKPDTPGVTVYLGKGPYTWESPFDLRDQNGMLVYVLEIDLPGLGDIDGDGDPDLVSMNAAGTQALLYENTGDCDSLSFTLVNECWGGFTEGGLSSQIFLNTTCFATNWNDTTETGSGHAGATLTLLDVDNDQLMDVLIGDINQSDITYLHNGGVQGFASMDEVQKNFPSGAAKVDLKLFPAMYVVDVDQDGIQDLIAVPNDPVAGRNARQIWWYRNTVGAGFQSLIRQQTDWLVGDMIDVGERSIPVLADINGDGIKDLVIGNHSMRQDNESSLSSLWYYQNTGTSDSPSFDLISDDWLSISTMFNPRISGLAPSFADLDGDGDMDMILGDRNGEIHYFRNHAGPGAPMQLSLVQASFLSVDAGQDAVPELIDLSEDGLPDLIIGNKSGDLWYLENQSVTGTSTPSFLPAVQGFGGIQGQFGTSIVPRFLEESGSINLYLGTAEGNLTVFDQVSTVAGATFHTLSQHYGNLPSIRYLSPAFYQSTGLLRVMIGSMQGGLQMYRESATNSLPDVWQNWVVSEPTPGILEINPSASFLSQQGRISIVDIQGTLLEFQELPHRGTTVSFDLRAFSNRLICVIVQTESQTFSKKLVLNN